MIYVDPKTNLPLPAGTALKSCLHEGIIDYDFLGRQILLHNSWANGKAMATDICEISDGPCQIKTMRLPRNAVHGVEITRRAWSDIQAGRKWTIFDNCEDFVSRAYGAGNYGSATRNLIIIGALAVGILAAVPITKAA